VTVQAIIVHAVFSEQIEPEWSKLAHGVCEEIAFLQAVTLSEEITSEWLARRDALVAQTASLLKAATMEESIRQWLAKNAPSSEDGRSDKGIAYDRR